MVNDPSCPVCGKCGPSAIGTQRFDKASREDSDYTTARLRVLFEVWMPQAQQILFKTVLCSECGFVFHVPRATKEDVNGKYEFLASCRGRHRVSGAKIPLRADRLFGMLQPYLPKRDDVRVLDFGGGDGRLMQGFVDSGLSVDLVDYTDTAIMGVRKIGDTEEAIPEDATYDAIVCSHVIEHIADPVRTTSLLISHLKRDGVIYVEVPLEVWAGPPRLQEPVTHINFFTPGSMRYVLQRAGGGVLSCGLDAQPHDSGRPQIVVVAFERRAMTNQQPMKHVVDTPHYLEPTLRMRVRRRLLMPSTISGAVLHKLGLKKR